MTMHHERTKVGQGCSLASRCTRSCTDPDHARPPSPGWNIEANADRRDREEHKKMLAVLFQPLYIPFLRGPSSRRLLS